MPSFILHSERLVLCHPETADFAALHAILADLMAGNEALRGLDAKTPRGDGVLGVVHALEQYGKYFEHPGWKPLPSDH